ncbi:MAG: hypothetical protein ACTSRP_11775 [Candidatus Helarchaeota archaeon]
MNLKSDRKFRNKKLNKLEIYLEPKEKILYSVSFIIGKYLDKITKYLLIGSAVFVSLMILIYVVPYLNLGNDILNILLFPIFIGIDIIILITIFIYFKTGTEKIKSVFLITNKKFYYISRTGRNFWTHSIGFNEVNAVVFKRTRFDFRKDKGAIEIISSEGTYRMISLRGVPHLSEVRKIIESILYEYGNIEQRFNDICLKSGYQIPLKLNISQKRLEEYARRKSTLVIYAIISIAIMAIVLIILNSLVPEFLSTIFGELDSFSILFTSIFNMIVIFIFGAFIITFLSERYKISKIIADKDSILTINSDNVLLEKKGMSIELPYTNELVLKYFKVIESFKTQNVDWETDYDGIEFKEISKGGRSLKFGPIDNFPEIYEFIFCYLLLRKKHSGELLNKEQIEKVVIENKASHILEKELELYQFKEDQIDVLYESIPAELKNELILTLKPYLDPKEEILLHYKPKIYYTKSIISIAIGVIMIWILFWLTIYIELTENYEYLGWLLMMVIVVIFPFFFCCIEICQIPGLAVLRKSDYIFTNQKVIIKYGSKICIIPYNNIESVIQYRVGFLIKVNQIQLNLKQEMDTIPFLIKNIITIPHVPLDNDLAKRIGYLKYKYG